MVSQINFNKIFGVNSFRSRAYIEVHITLIGSDSTLLLSQPSPTPTSTIRLGLRPRSLSPFTLQKPFILLLTLPPLWLVLQPHFSLPYPACSSSPSSSQLHKIKKNFIWGIDGTSTPAMDKKIINKTINQSLSTVLLLTQLLVVLGKCVGVLS